MSTLITTSFDSPSSAPQTPAAPPKSVPLATKTPSALGVVLPDRTDVKSVKANGSTGAETKPVPTVVKCEENSSYHISNSNLRNPTTLTILDDSAPPEVAPRKISTLELNEMLVPANTGKIKHLLMTYGPSILWDKSYLSALKTFVEKMPDSRFTIVIGGNDSKSSEEGFREASEKLWSMLKEHDNCGDLGRIRIVPAIHDYLSQWAQDGTLVRGNLLLKRDRISEDYDDAVPAIVAGVEEEFESGKLPGIEIDGGNQLATTENLLVGSDAVESVARKIERYPSSFRSTTAENPAVTHTERAEDLAKRMIQNQFPLQKLIIIGSGDGTGRIRQPAFHIDMAVTLLRKDPDTGKPVALVGDPSLAKATISALRARDPKGYSAVVNELNLKLHNDHGDPLDDLQTVVTAEDQKRFDSAAQTLQEQGFLVFRVPYLGTDTLDSREMGYPWITYNNTVVDGERVFMPVYGIPLLDDMAARVYRQQGYEVIPISAAEISLGHGALNCITKVLEREIEI